MILTKPPVKDCDQVIEETLSDEDIWELCKEHAAKLNIPAWKIAESIPWH